MNIKCQEQFNNSRYSMCRYQKGGDVSSIKDETKLLYKFYY